METFVLITGAWHGGWSWRPVAKPMGTFTEAPNQKPFFDLDVPSRYVLSVDDVALPPGEYGWTRFPERLGVTAIEAPGSHEANFTRPGELTDAFLEAVA